MLLCSCPCSFYNKERECRAVDAGYRQQYIQCQYHPDGQSVVQVRQRRQAATSGHPLAMSVTTAPVLLAFTCMQRHANRDGYDVCIADAVTNVRGDHISIVHWHTNHHRDSQRVGVRVCDAVSNGHTFGVKHCNCKPYGNRLKHDNSIGNFHSHAVA